MILTGWFAISPWCEFDMAFVTFGSLSTQITLQGLTHYTGADVGVLDVAERLSKNVQSKCRVSNNLGYSLLTCRIAFLPSTLT